MAKTTEASAPAPLWSPDDIIRLAEQQDHLATQFASIDQLLISLVERLNKTEATVALLDPDKATLPLELTPTLNLQSVYAAAIQGCVTGMLLGNPRITTDTKYRQQRINEALDLADGIILSLCNRHGVKQGTPTTK